MLGRRQVLAAAAGVLAAPSLGRAEETVGVTAGEIRIGNIMPYSGPNSAYGVIGKTEQAFVRMLNETTSFGGRKINFISYDDGFSPPKTVEQARRLIDQDKVAFLFNPLGTPTNSAIQRYCNQRKVPQLFVATGADKWGNWQEFPWTMGWQPSYRTEAQIYAKHLLAERRDFKLAIVYQNDDFGKDYVAGMRDVIGAERFDKTAKTASFEITDPTPDSQILSLQGSGADVLMIALGPKAAAQAIRKVHDIGWQPLRYLTNVSLSVGAVMQPAGAEKGVGTITSGYLKEQGDAAWREDPGMGEFRAFVRQWMPEADLNDSNVVYGFALGCTLRQVLTQCGDNFSRENILRQAAGLREVAVPVLLPGITLETGPQDYRPIQTMQLQRWDGASWVRFGGLIAGATA